MPAVINPPFLSPAGGALDIGCICSVPLFALLVSQCVYVLYSGEGLSPEPLCHPVLRRRGPLLMPLKRSYAACFMSPLGLSQSKADGTRSESGAALVQNLSLPGRGSGCQAAAQISIYKDV